MMIDPSKNCPCISCKTRTATCHGICPLYAKYRKQVVAYNKHVKAIKRQQNGGFSWDNPKGLLYRKKNW